MAELGDPPLGVVFDLPNRSRRIALDDQKQSAKLRIVGQIRLRQFVLSFTRCRRDEWNGLPHAECMQPTRKAPRHVAQMRIVQRRIVAAQTSPPGPHPAASLPQRIKSVQHNAIHAVVGARQELGVVLRKVVARDHTQGPCRPHQITRRQEAPRQLFANGEPPFPSERLGKGVATFRRKTEVSSNLADCAT